jgi:endonuclease/exonuclease/phosphatase family metal-dependent hydrolase
MLRTKRFEWLAITLAVFLSAGCDGGPKHVVTEQSVGQLFGISSAEAKKPNAALPGEESGRRVQKYFPTIEVPNRCPKERIVVASWNAGNFGATKSSEEIAVMADMLREADIVVLQEISTSEFGTRAVAKLGDILSRTGSTWEVATSGATQPKNAESEAYAVLWKPSKIFFDRKRSGLVAELENGVSREPFKAAFLNSKRERFSVYSFHAVPANKKPKNEIAVISVSKELTGAEKAVFAGDFNLSGIQADALLWKAGFRLSSTGKTSLKQKPDERGNYRLHDFDHAYVKGFEICGSGVIDFVERKFSPVTEKSLKEARKISDHLPVWVAIH